MSLDPRDPRLVPDHPHDTDGNLLYDDGCFWCLLTTAQPLPTFGHLGGTLPARAAQERRP